MPVTVYTRKPCSYCEAAKNLLRQRGVAYEEISMDSLSPEKFDEVRARSGMRTVPQIFFGDRLIGGYQELAAQDQKDKLASLK